MTFAESIAARMLECRLRMAFVRGTKRTSSPSTTCVRWAQKTSDWRKGRD